MLLQEHLRSLSFNLHIDDSPGRKKKKELRRKKFTALRRRLPEIRELAQTKKK
jgi:hypothetical protein